MESTPVSGVEMRNDMVAPRPAPLRRSATDTGTTPHEQIGRGTPSSEARAMFRLRAPPSRRVIMASGRSTRSAPAATNPSNR